jgi:putative Mn2+ efflux pump MntP
MREQLLGAFLISLLHGLIPSHWLPMVSIAKHQGWNLQKTLRFSFMLAMAHAISTILIGLVIATQSNLFIDVHATWFKWLPAGLLMGLGFWFLYRHHKHHHFHIHGAGSGSEFSIWPLLLAMFLSPCLEIEGFYFSLAFEGWQWIAFLSLIYLLTTLGSMLAWIWIAYKGLEKINAHRWTHNAGILTGIVLILSGLLFLLD